MPDPTIRASDQERAEVADQLSENASQGRLTLAELEERISAAHQAATRAQLAQLTPDLPVGAVATTPGAPERRRAVTRRITAVLGGTTVKGRWRPDREVNVRLVSVLGTGEVWRMPEETNGMSLRRARKVAKRAGTDQR